VIDKDEAQKLIDTYDGKRPACMDSWLDYVGMDEAEFDEIFGG
jgi:hypothetical protein